MFFIDSHCHLDFFKQGEGDSPAEVIKHAEEQNVRKILTIGTRISTAHEQIELAETYSNVFASVGVHPEYAMEEGENTLSIEDLSRYAKNPKVIGFGESGLDYHYGSEETHDAQKELFKLHLQASKKEKLPVIIHSREAEEDTISLLKQEASQDLTGVLHCFSSQEFLALAGLDLGFYLSASGIITFKKSEELRNIFKKVPLNRLLIETDAPYLAPTPYRGKTNEPAFVVKTAEVLAEIKGVSLEEIAEQTTENFYTLFKKASR